MVEEGKKLKRVTSDGFLIFYYNDLHEKDWDKQEYGVSNVFSSLSMLLTFGCMYQAHKFVIYLALLNIFFCMINVKFD